MIANPIIGRHARIGNDVQLINKENLTYDDGVHIHIRDSVMIVPYGASIPDQFVL